MSRPRTNSIPLHVDVDGVVVPATLRPPGPDRASWHVRWKMGGRWRSSYTGETVRIEAERVAREIVRGKPKAATSTGTLTLERFVEVQERHFGQRANQRRSNKTLSKFRTVWKDFNRFNAEILRGRVRIIQDVDEDVAAKYLTWLINGGAAPHGIHSKFGVLRAAWNRVRKNHPKSKKTITDDEKVTQNPWESLLGELPERPSIQPVQLDLDAGEFQSLHTAFAGRPAAQMLLVVSQWAAGRREEITHCQWDWVDSRGYIDIPDDIAKWGKGRVIRIPLAVLERLQELKEPDSNLVFAGFREEYRRKSPHGKRLLPTTAERLYETVGEHISAATKKLGLKGVSHHALRRTTMELSDQGEEIRATDMSSRNLGTTTKNKENFYVRKTHDRTFYLRADRLYTALSLALNSQPEVARIMMVDDAFMSRPEPAAEKARRIHDELDSMSPDELLEFERQKAKRKRKRG